MGRASRGWLRHPVLAAQHAGESQAAAPADRAGLKRRGFGGSPRRPDPARSNPGRRRRGARETAPGTAQASTRERSGRTSGRVDSAGAHLGNMGGATARSRRGSAFAPRRLGGGRCGRVPAHRRPRPRSGTRPRPAGHRGDRALASRDGLRVHRPRQTARPRRRERDGDQRRTASRGSCDRASPAPFSCPRTPGTSSRRTPGRRAGSPRSACRAPGPGPRPRSPPRCPCPTPG